MNLCIDIGNTRIKVGVFQDKEMTYFDIIDDDLDKEISRVFDHYDIKSIIISSTRDTITDFEEKLMDMYPVIRLDSDTSVPFKNLYKTPTTLGKDRIAVMAAASRIFHQEHNLVIDLGTCITYDFIDDQGTYYGGNIAPGMKMRLQAMHDYTDGLPRAKSVLNSFYLGQSTDEALQNGAVYGIKFEIEGLIRQLQEEFGHLNVILTGGNAEFFADVINSKIFVKPYFVLEGLNEILIYNA